MAGNDLYLSSKALTSSYSPSPIHRRINDVAPSLREEAGFYTNPLESTLKWLSVPQQVLYTLGKNLGEEVMQKELDVDSDFFTEMKRAVTGKGSVSFNQILQTVDLDSLDMALPDQYASLFRDNYLLTVPAAFAAGALGTFASGGNIIAGATAGFSTFSFLQGKGGISSVADVVFDPLNKLRLLPKTAQGLGLTDDTFKHLQKTGRLEDFIMNGKAKVPVKGSAPSKSDLFEATVRSDPKVWEEFAKNSKGMFDDATLLDNGNLLLQTTDIGLKTLADAKAGGVNVIKSTRVAKKGDPGLMTTIKMDNSDASLIGSILQGDRNLFDFRGSSGFVITPNSPFVGRFLVPGHTSIDLAAATNVLPAKGLDISKEFLGKAIANIPPIKKGLDAIIDFERMRVAPITSKASGLITKPFKAFLIPGAESGLQARKFFAENMNDPRLGGESIKKEFIKEYNMPIDATDTEVLNRVERIQTGLKAEELSDISAIRQRALSEQKLLAASLDEQLINKADDYAKTRVGQVIGKEARTAQGTQLLRGMGITEDDLTILQTMPEKEVLQRIDQRLHDIRKFEAMTEHEGLFELDKALTARVDLLTRADDLGKSNPELAKKMLDDATPSLPQSQVFDIDQLPKILDESMERTAHAQIFTKWGSSLHKLGKDLESRIKAANLNKEGLSPDQLKEQIATLNRSLDKTIEHEGTILNLLGGSRKLTGTDIEKLDQVQVAQRALRDVLDIKSMDMSDLLNYSAEEVNVFRNMMKLIGVGNSKKIGIQFDNARQLGKVTEEDFLVATMAQNMDPSAAFNATLRISQGASIDDVSGIMANFLWKSLDSKQLGEVTDILKRTGMTDEGINARFVTIFKQAVLNPGGQLREMEKKDAGVIGKIFDAFRKVLSFINFPKYIKDKTHKKLLNFIQGTELNLLSKELVGDELGATAKLYDSVTGELNNSKQLRDVNNRTMSAITPTGIIREVDGISANMDHVAHHTRRLKNTLNDQAYDATKASANLSVGNRGVIGPDQYRDLKRQLDPEVNPKLYDEVLETGLVSKNQLDHFLEVDDFTSTKSINSEVSATVNRILAYSGGMQKSAFSNDFGALIQGQEAVLKSKEMLPSVNFIAKWGAFTSKEAIQEDKAKLFKKVMGRLSLTHTLKDGGNTVQDNPMYGALLSKILHTLETQPASQLTENLRFIKSTLRKNKNISLVDFRKLQDSVKRLSSDNPAEHSVIAEANTFIADLLEREGDALLSQEGLIDQLVLNKDTAASMKETLHTRYRAMGTEEADGTLATQIKGLLDEGFADDGVQSIARGMEKAQQNILRTKGRRDITRTTEGDVGDTVPTFDTFSVFKKPVTGANNPIEEQFDGMYIPTYMHPVITKPKAQTWEEMGMLKKTLTGVFHGLTEGQASLATKKINTTFQNFFNKPEMNLLGDRFQNLLQGANYDYLLNIWKGHALISPAFHVRNVLSAFFVNTQHGVDVGSHKIAAEAAAFFRGDVGGIRGLAKSALSGRGRYDPTKVRVVDGRVEILDSSIQGKERELYELIARSQHAGVLAGGAGAEIVDDLQIGTRGDGGSLNPLSHDFGLMKINQEAAGFSEDLVRMATMHHADTVLKQSIEDSGKMTKALHFDYNLLTEFERQGMKRILPFYTYTRKAIARDTRMFMERTGQYYKLGQMAGAMSGDTVEKQEAVSGFIKDQLGVDVHVDDNGKHHYLLLGGLIPAADMVSMATAGLETTKKGVELSPSAALKELSFQFGKQATPFLKTPLEYTFNWNFYFNKPIKSIQGEQAAVFGQVMPKDAAALIQSVRWLRDLDKITNAAFDLKNPVNPNLPSASETEMGQVVKLMKPILGVNIVSNDRPQDNTYFNSILPQKLERRALIASIKKQARKGQQANLDVAKQNLRDFDLKARNDAESKFRARKEVTKQRQIFRPNLSD